MYSTPMTKQQLINQGSLSLKSTRAYFNQKLIGVMRDEVFVTDATQARELEIARKHLSKIITLIEDTIEERKSK